MTQTLKCQIMLKFKNMRDKKIKKKVQVVVFSIDQELAPNSAQVLLLEFNTKNNQGPTGFQNITGSVEENESFSQAAKRELLEETGIDSDILDCHFDFSFTDRWNKETECIEKIYLCVVSPENKKIQISNEHQSYKWVDINNIREIDYTFPSNFIAFNKAVELLGAKLK